jgi:glycerol kinase
VDTADRVNVVESIPINADLKDRSKGRVSHGALVEGDIKVTYVLGVDIER